MLWFSNPDCESLQKLFGWPLNRPPALKNLSKTLFLWPQSPWLKVMFKGCATLPLSSVWKICLNRTKRSPRGELLTLQWTEEISSPVITSAKLTMSVASLGINFTLLHWKRRKRCYCTTCSKVASSRFKWQSGEKTSNQRHYEEV